MRGTPRPVVCVQLASKARNVIRTLDATVSVDPSCCVAFTAPPPVSAFLVYGVCVLMVVIVLCVLLCLQNDLTFLRIRSNKHEIMVAPDKEYLLIVIQNPSADM